MKKMKNKLNLTLIAITLIALSIITIDVKGQSENSTVTATDANFGISLQGLNYPDSKSVSCTHNCDLIANSGVQTNGSYDPHIPFYLQQVPCWCAAWGSPNLFPAEVLSSFWYNCIFIGAGYDYTPSHNYVSEGVYQDIPLEANKTYTLKFYYWLGNPNLFKAKLHVMLTNQNFGDCRSLGVDEFGPQPSSITGTEIVGIVPTSGTPALYTGSFTTSASNTYNKILFYTEYTGGVSLQAYTEIKIEDIHILPTMPIAEAGTQHIICAGQCVAIGGTPTGSGGYPPYTYSWSNGSTLANPLVCPTAYTVYTVTVTNSNGCTATDNVPVYVMTSPPANAAGPDKSICKGSNTQLSASGGTYYLWSPSAGLSSTSISNPIANPTTTTTYTVSVTNSLGCSATDNVVVTVNLLPTANAGNDISFCKGNGSYIGVPTPFNTSYMWSPSGGLSATNISNPYANPIATTTYTVTVTNNSTGCSATDNVIVTVKPLPIANAGPDISICNGSNKLLSASGGTTYSWSPSGGLSATNISNPIAHPSTTTTYTVKVTNSLGCSATDNVIVTVNPLPIANAGPDKSICNGGSATIGILTGETPTTYAWSPSIGLSSISISNPTAHPSTTTTYTLTVTNSLGCSATDNVIVTVYPIPTVSLIANPSPIYVGGYSIITASPNGGTLPYNYYWCCGLSGNPVTVHPTTTTTYTLTVTDAHGCSANKSVIVNIFPQKSEKNNSNYCDSISKSLPDNSNFQGLSVFPNPTSGMVSFEFINGCSEEYLIKVININGKDVITKNYNATEGYNFNSLNLSSLKTGSYILIIKTKEKLIKAYILKG